MTLNHIDKRPGTVVVAGASFQTQALLEYDLDRLDVLRVPDRFEDAVGEAQPEQVEHRRRAEEVVNPVDLVFRQQPGERAVE